MEKLLLIDGNSIMNRSFYGTQDSFLKSASGVHTGALFGFMNTFHKYLKEEQPTQVAVAFDVHAPTFRHKMYDEYKAGRHGMPDELRQQMPLIKQILQKMGITVLELEGYEADDIIGTYAKRANEAGDDVRILTGDRDSFQLITDKTYIILPLTRMGSTDVTIYTPDEIRKKYGVEPAQMLEVKALMGDKSDNIPGLPGVGEKTALELISKYGTVENLYAHTDEIEKPALKKKIEENKELCDLSYKLAKINCDVPLDTPPHRWADGYADEKGLADLLTELQLTSVMKKFEVSAEGTAVAVKSLCKPLNKSEEIPVLKGGTLYIHFDKGFLNILEGESDTEHEIFLDNPMFSQPFMTAIADALADKNIKKVMWNAKPFIVWLKENGYVFDGLAIDASIAVYLADSTRKINDFKDIFTFFSLEEMPEGVSITAGLRYIEKDITERLEKDGMTELFTGIELPLVEVLADMEYTGFRIDTDVLREEGERMDSRIEELTERIYDLAGREFNINSPKQIGEILFDDLGLPGGKKTKTGAYSTSSEILESLQDEHDIIPLIIEYRQNAKLKSTFIDGLIGAVSERDGRVHSSFNQTVTATGRLSSTEPNLQNIPVRHELGRLIRKAFVPTDENSVLVDADYSQIELRVMAAMSGDERMITAFKEDKDIHTITAAEVNGIPEELVTPAMRSSAKAVNFGIIYGISDFGLAKDLGITRWQAGDYIKSYFETYPDIQAFLNELIVSAKEKGYAVTLFGRRRYLPELADSNKYMTKQFGERVARNMPVQGTAADIMKKAMIDVYGEINRRGLKAKLILQVHDELLIDAPESEAEEVVSILRTCMENAADIGVPLKVSAASGKTWYEAK